MNKVFLAKELLDIYGAYNFNSCLMQSELKQKNITLTGKTTIDFVSPKLASQVCNRVKLYKFFNPLQWHTLDKTESDTYIKIIKQVNKIYKNEKDDLIFDAKVKTLNNILSTCYSMNESSKGFLTINTLTKCKDLSEDDKRFLDNFQSELKNACDKIDIARGYVVKSSEK